MEHTTVQLQHNLLLLGTTSASGGLPKAVSGMANGCTDAAEWTEDVAVGAKIVRATYGIDVKMVSACACGPVADRADGMADNCCNHGHPSSNSAG